MFFSHFRRRAHERTSIPFGMFELQYSDSEARRARRMESIYHAGQVKIWDGREVLASAIEKHGKPTMPPDKRRALGRIFGMIMWGELAAWKISAQLADRLVPLEAKLAAASQVHDEARHFYVMHDYLEALGEKPERLEFWAEHVLKKTLGTDDMLKKLVGMQLTVETIALVAFQRVRELEIEPVLTELMSFYERDEARHIGLGIQLVPQLVSELSIAGAASLALFQLDILVAALASIKSIERDLLALGVDPRSLLGITFRRQEDIEEKIRAEFPNWPKDPMARRIFEGVCEALFPSEGLDARVSTPTRILHAIDVVRRRRPSVFEEWGKRTEVPRGAAIGLTIPPPPPPG